MGVYVGDSLVAGNVGEVYTKAQVDTMIANAVALAEPVGSIKPFAGTTVPDGYLLCDGSAISRTTYAALFAVIGTTYGTGDGSTTFNLPDLNDRLPRMASNHTIGGKNSGWAPNIYGWFETVYHKTSTITDGTLFTQYEGVQAGIAGGSFLSNYRIWLDASRVWSGYNTGVTSIMAQNLTMYYVIKY